MKISLCKTLREPGLIVSSIEIVDDTDFEREMKIGGDDSRPIVIPGLKAAHVVITVHSDGMEPLEKLIASVMGRKSNE